MIEPAKIKVMLVPDFGVNAEDGATVELQQAIEAQGRFSVKIVDLLRMVREEHPGEDLKDSVEIEMCARKLEALATDKSIEWGNLTDDYCYDPLHDLYPDDDSSRGEVIMKKEAGLTLRIRKTVSDGKVRQAPDVLVVFGKSVMLAGGIKEKPILFVDPVYDSEWPWKKQYYADRDAASEYILRYFKEISEPEDTQVIWTGAEVCRRPKPTLRYGIFTGGKDNYSSEFSSRYHNLEMIDETLKGNPEQLAKTICEFAESDMEFPLFDIYRMVETETKGCQMVETETKGYQFADICTFDEPIKIGGVTALGLKYGMPMANGQSMIKLRTAENRYPIPIEGFRERSELTALRDAVSKAVEKLTKRKRILIVPDYFIPYNAPHIIMLRDCLRRMGYYVAIYIHGELLEKSRAGIERRCKVKPFDLIIALETGCLVTARIMNSPRIFVNPDWAIWKWMKSHLDEKPELYETRGIDNSGPFWAYYLNAGEVAEARKMAERSYIRRGKHCVYGWFSEDCIEDSKLPEEHIKRFNTCTYVPGLRLDTDRGIAQLAHQADNILKIDEN